MTKEIKGFITRDDFITSPSSTTSPVYELSPISLTYAKEKSQYYSTLDSLYSLYTFSSTDITSLSQTEVDDIIYVVTELSAFLTSTLVTNKQQAIVLFTADYNSKNPSKPVSGLNYNTIVNYNNIAVVDYLTFSVSGIVSNIWLSDAVFRAFYPEYDINIVLPFSQFSTLVGNTSNFITALNEFDLIVFNARVEEDKSNKPTTYTKIINIPYKVPNTSVTKNCYFAFNIYGLQGNYDYILKLELYNYLTVTLGLDGELIESLFPTILNINEFFITPRWDKVAIPTQVGQTGINSQIASAYAEEFDLDSFVKVYTNITYLKQNTYTVPFDYNNLLLEVTNGYYTEASKQDFKKYYSDLITVTSSHPDFARMSQKTQRFITLLENIINVSDSENSTELFNNLLANSNYHFTIITRAGISYISIFYEDHQYYVIPKYEMLAHVI